MKLMTNPPARMAPNMLESQEGERRMEGNNPYLLYNIK